MLAPMLAATLHAIERVELGQDGDQSCISSDGSVGGTLDARCSHSRPRVFEQADRRATGHVPEDGRQPDRAHLQKIGCSSRAEARLFATQQVRSASYRPLKDRATPHKTGAASLYRSRRAQTFMSDGGACETTGLKLFLCLFGGNMNTLLPGQFLQPGHPLSCANGAYSLWMQTDGSLGAEPKPKGR